MNLPEIPKPGQPLTALWGRRVAEALRALRPSAGPGVRVSTTMNGTTISAPRRERAAEPPEPGSYTGQITYWNETTHKWETSDTGTLREGDMLMWDGAKYVRKSLAEMLRYHVEAHELQVLAWNSDVQELDWLTVAEAVPFPPLPGS